MRKVILGLAVSLDGFIEGPNGEFDWCFTDQDYGLSAFYQRIDAVFFGRKSYELIQRMAASDPPEYADPRMDALHKYVFSNTMDIAQESIEVVRGTPDTQVARIKSLPGKDIWLFGGAELIQAFMAHGLVDELWLSVHPILLGSGKPLFLDLKRRTHLELISHQAYDTGLVSLWYRIKNQSSSQSSGNA